MPKISTILSSAFNTAKRLPALTSAATSLVLEDPAHFAIQVSRRVPRPIRELGENISLPAFFSPTAHAFWASCLDQTTRAADALQTAPASRIANALRVQHKIALPANSAPDQLAREMWELGDLAGALATAPADSHLAAVLRSNAQILAPRSRITLTPNPQQVEPAEDGQHPRVLHILTNSLPWTTSGYALRTHNILRNLVAQGVAVRAVTRIGYPLSIGKPQAGTRDVIDGVEYQRILPTFLPRLPHLRLAAQAQAVLKIAQDFGATVLHTTTTYENALVTQAVAEALGIPWVYEMRGELEKTWVSRHPAHRQSQAENSERFHLMRNKETEMAQAADAVVALSQVQRDQLIQRGIAPQKIHIMPNAVDESYLAYNRDPLAARQTLSESFKLPPNSTTSDQSATFWVGTVSAIVGYEGLDVLIRAIAQLKQSGIDIACAIVGDGVALPNLKLLAQELGIADSVIFPGKVAPEKAVTWYQALDAFVIPRVDTPVTRTVTPMKGLQAMALGIPQIVSDLPALREISAADGQGIAVPPGDVDALAQEISRLMNDQALQGSLSSHAIKAAKKRTWQFLAHSYTGLYTGLSH